MSPGRPVNTFSIFRNQSIRVSAAVVRFCSGDGQTREKLPLLKLPFAGPQGIVRFPFFVLRFSVTIVGTTGRETGRKNKKL